MTYKIWFFYVYLEKRILIKWYMKLKNIGFLENNDTRFCYFVVRPGNNASLLIIYIKKVQPRVLCYYSHSYRRIVFLGINREMKPNVTYSGITDLSVRYDTALKSYTAINSGVQTEYDIRLHLTLCHFVPLYLTVPSPLPHTALVREKL